MRTLVRLFMKKCRVKNIFTDVSIDANGMPGFFLNDIALLELEEEVDLTMYTPVCLARAGITESGENINLLL